MNGPTREGFYFYSHFEREPEDSSFWTIVEVFRGFNSKGKVELRVQCLGDCDEYGLEDMEGTWGREIPSFAYTIAGES